MGSSKKRKEHKRSRSRSGSREKDRSSRKRRHHREDTNEESERKSAHEEKSPEKKRKLKDESTEEQAGSSGGGEQLSMSIEESNKLRAQLGLAPLEVNEKPKTREVQDDEGQTMQVVKVDGNEFVHKPAENWGTKKEAETIREKLQALRERRQMEEKLGQVDLLGDADEDDSAAAWVQKQKRMEEEKRLAELRAKMLEEMEEGFVVPEAPKDVKKKPAAKKATSAYTSKDLAGMTVQHSKDVLLEGHDTVLVLQDKDVLDESEDVLMNPSLAEFDKWKQNAELRKKKPGYNPYDEELDEFGMPKPTMLGKYDEEIEGQKKESFKLGARGEANIQAEQERASMLAKLREGAESLDTRPLEIANEYMTSEEMAATFKKTKKKVKKIRKRVTDALKADDLLANAALTDEDFGSRQRGRGRKKADYETGEARKDAGGDEKMEPGEIKDEEPEPMETAAFSDDDTYFVLSDDEAEQELQAALARARQLQQMEARKIGAEKTLLPKMEPEDEDQDDMDATNGKIVLDSISEYCRGLGDIPTYGMAGNRDDVDEEDLIDVEQETAKASTSQTDDRISRDEEEELNEKGGWFERDINDKERLRSKSPQSSDDELSREPILEEEPDMTNMGVAAALKLAVQKGYLKEEKPARGAGLLTEQLRAKRYTIVDKQFHDIDDKYAKKLERMGGGGGPIVEFKEKADFKPDVKIQYPDEKGRLMDAKDAFRHLSWKFHGKQPGKKKVEKRNKKLMEKELFNEMSSTDTPLGTLSKQIDKQRQLQTPFLVLSGTGSKDGGMSIKKD